MRSVITDVPFGGVFPLFPLPGGLKIPFPYLLSSEKMSWREGVPRGRYTIFIRQFSFQNIYAGTGIRVHYPGGFSDNTYDPWLLRAVRMPDGNFCSHGPGEWFRRAGTVLLRGMSREEGVFSRFTVPRYHYSGERIQAGRTSRILVIPPGAGPANRGAFFSLVKATRRGIGINPPPKWECDGAAVPERRMAAPL